VESVGATIDELLNKLGNIGAGSPLGRQVTNLLLGGDLAGQQKPEETLGQGFLTTGSLGQELLALGDLEITMSKQKTISESMKTYSVATETDTLLRVEDGAL
jgi:hypothetical protein